MGGLFSTFNGSDSLLDAVPTNGSKGPHCFPVPLCRKRMQVLYTIYWIHGKIIMHQHSTQKTVHTNAIILVSIYEYQPIGLGHI